MESITAARNISGLEPMSVLHGIAPLCVPMTVSGDFADEVGNRAVPRIVSLWERLGLFYMLEQPQTAPVSNTRVTVNNFTAQMIFRLCSFSHTDRLIERYQPGSVFPENIRRASQENGRTLLNFTHAGRELGCEAYSVKLTEEDGGYVLSAKLRRRDGSRLPEELKDAAMSELYSIVRAGLDALG